MNYKLEKSSINDLDKLIEYKKNNIFMYDPIKDLKEINKINNYVSNNIPKHINDYFNIVINNKIVGCLLYYPKDDGILLDEIYIEEEYRNLGIGSNIISNILSNNNIVYLYVYKDNTKAVNLYKRLGFNIIEETEYRYYMKYEEDYENNR